MQGAAAKSWRMNLGVSLTQRVPGTRVSLTCNFINSRLANKKGNPEMNIPTLHILTILVKPGAYFQ